VAELLHGFAIGVRDVPQRGLMVRVTPTMFGGADLEPAEAAALGQALIAQAEEAVHASRARRRDIGPRCPACRAGLPTHDERDPRCELRLLTKTCRAPSAELGYDCSRDEGHTGKHGYAECFW
jgi:hypothetical protein